MSPRDPDFERRIIEQSQRLRVDSGVPPTQTPATLRQETTSSFDQRILFGGVAAIGVFVMVFLLFSATGGGTAGGGIGTSEGSSVVPAASGGADGAAAAEMVARFYLSWITGDMPALETCLASSALPVPNEVHESLSEQRSYYDEDSFPSPTMGWRDGRFAVEFTDPETGEKETILLTPVEEGSDYADVEVGYDYGSGYEGESVVTLRLEAGTWGVESIDGVMLWEDAY